VIDLRLGDCLDLLKTIPPGSIDFILVDPPYGTTQCKWDVVIPVEPMWAGIWKALKPTGACAIFGSEPFSSVLRCSQMGHYKYDWIWVKDKSTNHLNARRQPLRQSELISVFYKKQCQYSPILFEKDPKNVRKWQGAGQGTEVYGKMDYNTERTLPDTKGYPKNLLYFNGLSGVKNKTKHPTQKPVDLLKYLIRTYTSQGQVVLDFAMGSGSCGVAAKQLNRDFIGFEKDSTIFDSAVVRIGGAND